MALWPSFAWAQAAPGVFTTVRTNSTAATSICVGCPASAPTVPAANSGITAATVVLPSGVPSVTTNKLYSSAGALFFNGLSLATGSSISGTTNQVPKFTAATTLGDSTISDNGTTVTIAALAQINGTVTSGTNGAAGTYLINGPSATNRVVGFRTAGVNRWLAYTTSVAESGGNAGSNFRLDAYDDAGSLIGTAMLATRSSMAITLGGALTVTGASVLSGATTVATSLQLVGAAPVFLGNTNNGYLFRNSTNGSTLLSITDAGAITLPGATTASSTLSVAGVLTSTVNSATFGLEFTGANGGGITASNAAGALRFYTGSSTLRWSINAAGGWMIGATPHLVDSNETPTILSGFGTSPSIAGKSYAFVVTLGSGAGNVGGAVITDNVTTYTASVCVASTDNATIAAALQVLTSTTNGMSIGYPSGTYTGSKIWVMCRGY